MYASLLTRHHEAVTQEEHQAAHLRDVRLCALKRTDHGAVFVVAQVIGNNIAEPSEQLMVHGVSVPEEHLPYRRYRCLWFDHSDSPFLVLLSLSRPCAPLQPSVRVSRSLHAWPVTRRAYRSSSPLRRLN